MAQPQSHPVAPLQAPYGYTPGAPYYATQALSPYMQQLPSSSHNGAAAAAARYAPSLGQYGPVGKRAYDEADESDDEDEVARRQSVASSSGGTPAHARAAAARDDKAKRVKTVRACDSCRRKKIRCNPIDGTEPPVCAHCKQHGFECTWFLPITETRFKRKREQEEAAAAEGEYGKGASGLSRPTPTAQTSLGRVVVGTGSASPESDDEGLGKHQTPARIYGPTSMSYMMHSTASFPVERMSAFDSKHFQRLEARCTGDGLIQVFLRNARPEEEAQDVDIDREGQGPGPIRMPYLPDGGGNGLAIPAPVAEQLVNYFFDTVVTILPIMSRDDFLHNVPLSPLIFYSICGVASLKHDVDPVHRRALRDVMSGMHRRNEMLAQGDIGTIQSLILYALSCEFERNRAGPVAWNGMGTAIRMAQLLGLHRESIVREQHDDHSELRRRIWGACLIGDRWLSAMYGLPMMIDLHECDRLFPSVHDVRPGAKVDKSNRPFSSMVAMIELSILLGRVLKLLYSPTGILNVTDEQANSLKNDLEAWQRNLDDDCKFTGQSSSMAAGWLHLSSVPVWFLLYRPFMRISYQCPETLSFSVQPPQFAMLLQYAREAILWTSEHPAVLEHFVSNLYALFTCCLINYHTHIRRRDAQSLETLGIAKGILYSINMPESLTRNKVTEIVSLLYSTASTVSKWYDQQAAEGTSSIANPTAGAKVRAAEPNLRWVPPKDGGDLGHYETATESAQTAAGRPSSDPSPAGSQPTARQTTLSSVRSTVDSVDHLAAPPPPQQSGPSAHQAQGSGAAGWPPLTPGLLGLPPGQYAPTSGEYTSCVNVNPSLNLDAAPLAEMTGSIDFFGGIEGGGDGGGGLPFPPEMLDWDWSKLFGGGMLGGQDAFATGI